MQYLSLCQKCWRDKPDVKVYQPEYSFKRPMCKPCRKLQKEQDLSGDHDRDESMSNHSIL